MLGLVNIGHWSSIYSKPMLWLWSGHGMFLIGISFCLACHTVSNVVDTGSNTSIFLYSSQIFFLASSCVLLLQHWTNFSQTGNEGCDLLSQVDGFAVWVWTILPCVQAGAYYHYMLPCINKDFHWWGQLPLLCCSYSQLDNIHWERKMTAW